MGAPSALPLLLLLPLALSGTVWAQQADPIIVPTAEERWVDLNTPSPIKLYDDGQVNLFDFGVSPAGTPTVAFADAAQNGTASVARLVNGAWSYLGTRLTNDVPLSLSLSFSPAGVATLAAYEVDRQVGLKKSGPGNGGAGTYTLLPGPAANQTAAQQQQQRVRVRFGQSLSQAVSMAWDRAGTPWMAFEGQEGFVRVVQRANPTEGQMLTVGKRFGEGFKARTDGRSLQLAFDSAGTPWVAYIDADNSETLKVVKFDAGQPNPDKQWVHVPAVGGVSPANSSSLSLAFKAAGMPCVSFVDTRMGQFRPTVRCLSVDELTWIPLWGGALTSNQSIAALSTSLAVHPLNGDIYLAYDALRPREVAATASVLRWEGRGAGGWEHVGSPGIMGPPAPGYPAGTYPMSSRLAFDGQGRLHLAFFDYSSTYNIIVKRLEAVVPATVKPASPSPPARPSTNPTVTRPPPPAPQRSPPKPDTWSELGAASKVEPTPARWSRADVAFAVSPAVGDPVVAFADGTRGGRLSVVRMLPENGGRWTFLAQELSLGNVTALSMVASPSGPVSVVYFERLASSARFQACLAQVRLSSDVILGPGSRCFVENLEAPSPSISLALEGTNTALYAAIVLNNKPVVLRLELPAEQNVWQVLPFGAGVIDSDARVSDVRVTVGNNGTLWLSFIENGQSVKLLTREPKGGWRYALPLRQGVSPGDARGVSMAMNARGTFPLLSFVDQSDAERSPPALAWIPKDTSDGPLQFRTNVAFPNTVATSLALNPATQTMHMAILSGLGNTTGITVMRLQWRDPAWGKQRWEEVGPPKFTSPAYLPSSVDLAFDEDGTAHVAFTDRLDGGKFKVLKFNPAPPPPTRPPPPASARSPPPKRPPVWQV